MIGWVRALAVLAASMVASACCDDSDRYMTMIPWGGAAVPPVIVGVGDSLPFSAYVAGRPRGSGFFADCRLYDSQTHPDRFEFTLSDTSVVAIEPGVSENYVVAKSPGSTVLTAASSGVASLELPITVLPSPAALAAPPRTTALAAAIPTAASARCARLGARGA
jgi:hypothetical protein